MNKGSRSSATFVKRSLGEKRQGKKGDTEWLKKRKREEKAL